MSDPHDSEHETIELPTSPQPPAPPSPTAAATKADLGKRAVAVIVDSVIAGLMSVVIPGVGGLIATIYMVCRDGLEFDFMDHRSIGKHVMKLHIESTDGAPLDLMTSVRRNWLFAFAPLATALAFIPILGWILLLPVGLLAMALGLTEIVLVLSHPDGRRLGDRIASTRVRED